jgi:hypothetical protein
MSSELTAERGLVNLTGVPVPLLVEHPQGRLEGLLWEPEPTRVVQVNVLTILPVAGEVRVATSEVGIRATLLTQIGEIPVASLMLREPEGLPDPTEDVAFLVPTLVALVSSRKDLLVIHGRVRNQDTGISLGVFSLGQLVS